MDEPIPSQHKPLSKIKTSVRKTRPLESDLEPTLIIPDTKTLSDDSKPDSEPELKPQSPTEEIKDSEPKQKPKIVEPKLEPLPPPKLQLGPKPEPRKPSEKIIDPKPKQEPSKSVQLKSPEPKQESLKSIRPKPQEPKPAALPKPEPTSPEELQAIEQTVDDWVKAKAPAGEPTEKKTWVV